VNENLRDFSEKRVMIMAAPNGARRGKQDHPALSVTANELADEAVALRDAAVAVLHVHVRDTNAKHTLDPDHYRAALTAIRARVGDDLVLQVTTEAAGQYSADQQMAVIRELQPEAVSLALRELCPTTADEPAFGDLCRWMHSAAVWPQYILYDAKDIQRFEALRAGGVIVEQKPFALFVLGKYSAAVGGRIADLKALLQVTGPMAYPWAACCFGSNEHVVMRSALALGGHVRIGFENNVLLSDGTPAPNNAALIREFVAAAAAGARKPASADEVRSAFGLGRGTT